MPTPSSNQPLDLHLAAARLRELQDYEKKRGLRFIIELTAPLALAKVRAKVKAVMGPKCRVERLFRGKHGRGDRLNSFYVATVPGLAVRLTEPHVFDLATRLRESDSTFRSVEPDTPSSAYQPAPEDFGLASAELSSIGCWADPVAMPADTRWSIRNVRVPEAWALEPPTGGRRFGEGSVVGHPDTGHAEHVELDATALDLSRAFDFVDEEPDATDPLESGWLEQPGHGTATGSVIVSRESGQLSGSAPAATLVPIRCTRSVVLVFNGSDVARAIEHAADNGCHVISMSLGGVPRRALEEAVNYAVSLNVIVAAAAGNCVGFVTAPAIYDNCLAVAGTNFADRPWQGSSHGAAVDISGPGEFVWCAHREPGDGATNVIRAAQGTSFAVATLAGVAALWLSFHSRQALLTKYAGGPPLQHVFAHVLMNTARRPPGWDSDNYGAGIIDAQALLAAPLPTFGFGLEGLAAAAAPDPGSNYRHLLEKLLGPERARQQIDELFANPADVEKFGAEIFEILLKRGAGRPELGLPDALHNVPAAAEASRASRVFDLVVANASQGLRIALAPASLRRGPARGNSQ